MIASRGASWTWSFVDVNFIPGRETFVAQFWENVIKEALPARAARGSALETGSVKVGSGQNRVGYFCFVPTAGKLVAMRKRQEILTPHGYQVARRDEFRGAVKTLKKLYPHEPKEEIERVVWSFVMGRPTRSQDELVELAIDVLGTTPTPRRHHATKKLNRVQATYVKLKGKRGFDAYAVQLPADNQWGFELVQAKGEWSQSWPGGLGLATEWAAIPKTKVPAKVRSEMDWLFGA